jgi:hypothetical protein
MTLCEDCQSRSEPRSPVVKCSDGRLQSSENSYSIDRSFCVLYGVKYHSPRKVRPSQEVYDLMDIEDEIRFRFTLSRKKRIHCIAMDPVDSDAYLLNCAALASPAFAVAFPGLNGTFPVDFASLSLSQSRRGPICYKSLLRLLTDRIVKNCVVVLSNIRMETSQMIRSICR